MIKLFCKTRTKVTSSTVSVWSCSFLLACGKLIMPINNKGWGEGRLQSSIAAQSLCSALAHMLQVCGSSYAEKCEHMVGD